VLIGLIAGLVGGLVTGGAQLLRRTATAPDRLVAAVDPGDLHVQVFADALTEPVAGSAAVAEAWRGRLSVARLDGPAVVYVGILAAASAADVASPLARPVVVDGRAPDAAAADEVLVVEEAAERFGFAVGDRLPLALLTAEEVGQFDVGFGEPDGARVDALVTGVARVPPGSFGAPVLATPAFAAAHEASMAGTDLFVRLRPGVTADAFRAEIERLAEGVGIPAATAEFPPAVVDDPLLGTRALERSARVLLGGLAAAVVVAAVAALLALAQAFARHHGAGAADQRVESALGMTAGERVAARVLPAGVGAALAGATTFALGWAGGVVEPAGAVAAVEPRPGHRADLAVLLAGAVAVAVAVVAVAAVSAQRAGRRAVAPVDEVRTPGWTFAPRRHGWPLAGVAFALSRGSREQVPVRTSLVGAVVGVAGVVAALTFSASLDRLVGTPERYGWDADLVLVDVRDESLAELLADARVSGLADVASAVVPVDGRDVQGYSFEQVRGDVGWQLRDGREPEAPGEVALGVVLARDLGVGVGDDVELGAAPRRATVVGVGLGPAIDGEALGGAVLVAPGELPEVALSAPFREAVVDLRADVDVAVAAADLGARYEIVVRSLPREVQDLADLGSLPEVLGGFLGALAAVALAHALLVTARRRTRDLAVLRAIGATPREAGLAIVATGLATVSVGGALGVPLGWAVARLVWGELARSVGVRADVLVPAGVAAVVLAALALAAVLAVLPARRAVRAVPGPALRSE